MRPKPRMPSVFSYSSTPENFERSHLPLVSDACAWGMLRASASSSAIVCSAAVTTFDSGALATTIPRRVAAATSTLSTPTPARPITRRLTAPLDQLGGHLRRRADQDAVVVADALVELLLAPVDAEVDVEALRSSSTPESPTFSLTSTFRRSAVSGAAGLMPQILSTTQSMHAVRARTSSGSTAGNMPIRSWLRPSLR